MDNTIFTFKMRADAKCGGCADSGSCTSCHGYSHADPSSIVDQISSFIISLDQPLIETKLEDDFEATGLGCSTPSKIIAAGRGLPGTDHHIYRHPAQRCCGRASKKLIGRLIASIRIHLFFQLVSSAPTSSQRARACLFSTFRHFRSSAFATETRAKEETEHS